MTDASIYVPPRLPDNETTDCKLAYVGAVFPDAGFVTALPAIAYLASRSEWFAGAAKAHEIAEYATRDAHFAAAVWREVETNLHHYFPETVGMLAAMDTLRNLLESGAVGGIAKPIGSERSEKIEPFQFADWNRTWERQGGLILIPGYWDLKVDAAALRRSLPAPPPVVVKPRGTKFIKMAERLAPIFGRHHERWSAVPDDPARARMIRAALDSSPNWRDTTPDVKTIRRHWDHFVATRK